MTTPSPTAPSLREVLIRRVVFEGLVSDGDMLIPSESLRAALVELRSNIAASPAPSQLACPACKTPSACRVHGCCAEPAVEAESLPIVAWQDYEGSASFISDRAKKGACGQQWPTYFTAPLTPHANAQAQINALIRELDNVKAHADAWRRERDEAVASLSASQAPADVATDAARYRWLRDEAVWRADPDGRGEMIWAVVGSRHDECIPIDGSQLDHEIDRRIDAAMASTKG